MEKEERTKEGCLLGTGQESFAALRLIKMKLNEEQSRFLRLPEEIPTMKWPL